MKYSVTRGTPRDMRYAFCDVCKFKYHIKDLTKVVDKYSRQYGLLVCKKDLDKTNPQLRPLKITEKIVENVEIMRPRMPIIFSVNPNDDRLPGKPTDGQANGGPFGTGASLNWMAPLDQGSSVIIGYIISRSAPTGITYITTTTGITSYFDEDAVVTSFYTYSVAAYNSFGTGPYSDEFYWPASDGLAYWITAPDGYTITTGGGDPIVFSGV